MKIGSRRDYFVNLESVAMTDIVLNMFIFFFISFSLLYTFDADRLQKLGVKIPKAKNAVPVKDAERINITIASDGITYLEKKALLSEELREEIEQKYKNNPELHIILHADQLTQFRYITKVIDVLSGLGIKDVNIAVTAEK
jgi:biopolymer transport protein ExbD